MLRLYPQYDRDTLTARLFHNAVRHQWSAEDLDWDAPAGLSPRQALALTNIITPVYLGEQAAMNGAARVLPQLIQNGETAAQLYLATFLLDEARHFDALTRLYAHFGHRPLPVRRMPEMLRYHLRLSRGDRIDWLWGILISDIFAREFYLTFAKVQPAALFGRMSVQILRDESRHQAFAHTYLRNALPGLSDARRQALAEMRDDLLETMEGMSRHLRADTDVLSIDGDAFLKDLVAHIEAHAAAIGLGARRGGGGPPGGGARGEAPADAPDWMQRLRSLRERALRDSGGVDWPERSDPPPDAPLGSRMVADDTPALTAADLRLLVGREPRGRRPARRVFAGARRAREAATCGACALIALCRRVALPRPPAVARA